LVSATTTDGILLECTNQQVCNVVEKSVLHHGYYVNAGDPTTNPYIICTKGVSSTECELTTTSSSCSNVGIFCKDSNDQIIKVQNDDSKFILFNTDPTVEDKIYIMSNAQNNIFTSESDAASPDSIVIRSKLNAIVIDQVLDGVHAYEIDDDLKAEEVTLGPDGSLTDKSKLQLYLCAENLCTRTYGYARIDETDYIVHADDNKDIEPRTLTTCGSATDIGHLYENGAEVKLCLNYDADTPIGSRKLDATGDAVTYVMENKLNNVFTNVDPADSNGVMIKSIPYAYVLDTNFKGRS